jgi:hypothetical protein
MRRFHLPNPARAMRTLLHNPLMRATPTLPDWANVPLPPLLARFRDAPPPEPVPDPEPQPAPIYHDPRFPVLDYTLHPGGGDTGRVLVLLRGINTAAASCADQAGQWAFITDGLKDLYSRIVYFSYSASDPDAYTELDTHQSLWTHHRPLLYNLLASCYAQGWQSFDLVGHSLGGVIASEYILAHGLAGPQAGWVQHVITLDSPVNGSSRIAANNFAFESQFTTLGVKSALDLADLYLDRDHYEKVRQRTLADLQTAGIAYWNLTSVDDWVVPVEDAILAATHHRMYHLGRQPTSPEPSINRGHAQVFYSERVRNDMRIILESDTPPPQETVRTRSLPLPEPAAVVLDVAADGLRRYTDNRLLGLGMQLAVMHYYRDDTESDVDEADPAAELRQAVRDRLKEAVDRARERLE